MYFSEVYEALFGIFVEEVEGSMGVCESIIIGLPVGDAPAVVEGFPFVSFIHLLFYNS